MGCVADGALKAPTSLVPRYPSTLSGKPSAYRREMLVASEWQALAHQALQALTSLVPRYKRGPAGGADLAGLALPFDALRGAKCVPT